MGRGIYKGKLSWVETAARSGHPSPMILSLGHDSCPCLPPGRSTPELAGCPPSSLWSAGPRPFKGRRGTRGPNWGSIQYDWTQRQTRTHGEHQENAKAETGLVHLQAKERPRPEGVTRRERGTDSPSEPQRDNPASSLTSDFRPPQLWDG